MKNRILFTLFLCLVGSTIGFAQRVGRTWHNINAKYNAYILASLKLQEVKNKLADRQVDDYARVVPILYAIDSTLVQDMKPLLTDAIKKASLIVERHGNSDYLEKAYNLIGEARLMQGDFLNASEAFKYVNTNGESDDERTRALIGLMRINIEENEPDKALRIAELIKNSSLSPENAVQFYLTKAYLHQKRGEYSLAAGVLEEVLEVSQQKKAMSSKQAALNLVENMGRKGEIKARWHYIAGQLYDELKVYDKATIHYKALQKYNPNYELGFFAEANRLLNDARNNPNANTEAAFERMLKESKNKNLKDKIYAQMANVALQQKNYPKTIDYLKKSVSYAAASPLQLGDNYAKLGQIYDEQFQNYDLARAYYDSTLQVLPLNAPAFATIEKKQKILNKFVEYTQTISREDSLQRLAKLDILLVDKLLENHILELKKEEKAKKDLAEKVIAKADISPIATDADEKNLWQLYQPTYLVRIKNEFTSQWGIRPLEDNWRRSAAASGASISFNPKAPVTEAPKVEESISAEELEKEKMKLKAEIPFSPDAMVASQKKQEDAYFQLGKLYHVQLNDAPKATKYFQTLLQKYPQTSYLPETLYFLALLPNGETAKQRLLQEFTNTSFARNLVKISTGNDAQFEVEAQRSYANCLELYQTNQYEKALVMSQDNLKKYTGSKIEDKLALLYVMATGKTKKLEVYQKALDEFMLSYPNSPLLNHVQMMKASSLVRK